MGLGDLAGMMGKMKQMQSQMQQMQQELEKKTVQASSGGGMVTAVVNGKGDLLELKIEPEAVDTEDLEMLEDLVKAAVNAALLKSRKEMQQQMQQQVSQLTGGINLPGMENIGKMLGL